MERDVHPDEARRPVAVHQVHVPFHAEGQDAGGHHWPEGADRQWKVEKGVVDAGKVTFQVQQPDGPLRSFTLKLVKDRLQGDQRLEFKGQTADVTVDAERAK